MTDLLDMAKQRTQPAAAATPQPSAHGRPTTWKASEQAAIILRKIQAYVGGNQEDILDLFLTEFDNRLAILQAEDIAARKKRLGE